jgi:hypothetical protein
MVMIGRGIKNFFKGLGSAANQFFQGTPTKVEPVSNLRPEQEGLYQQYQQALANQPGGAFGPSMQYYNDILNNQAQDYDQLAAPELRRFNQQIAPGIMEQFAGMGAGGLDSSGFQHALANAGVDLSERLAAMRANLRQNAAQGLAQIGQFGFSPFSQNQVTEEGSQGFAEPIAKGIGQVAGMYAKSKLGLPPVPTQAANTAQAGNVPQPSTPAYLANSGNMMKQRLNNYSGASSPPYGSSPYGNQSPINGNPALNRFTNTQTGANPMTMNRY